MANTELNTKEFKVKDVSCICTRAAKGGNSVVYKGMYNSRRIIIKEFACKSKYDKEIKKRLTRFTNEIDFMTKNKIEGIIPIIDYSLSQEQSYYVMPELTPLDTYILKNGIKFEKIINIFIELAKIIKQLHLKNIAHRDIKIKNLYVEGEKIFIGDFGLIKDLNKPSQITMDSEKIGPSVILPPEARRTFSNSKIDYKKMDIYLLAKVLWQCLKKEQYGFCGEYRRGDSNIYLNSVDFGISNIDPIHELMEKSTYDDFKKRINIDDVLKLLNKELLFLHGGDVIKGELVKYRCIESIKKNTLYLKPDEVVYKNRKVIDEILDIFDFNFTVKIYLDDNPKLFKELLINRIDKSQGNNRFYIFECSYLSNNLTLFCDISEIILGSDSEIKFFKFNNFDNAITSVAEFISGSSLFQYNRSFSLGEKVIMQVLYDMV